MYFIGGLNHAMISVNLIIENNKINKNKMQTFFGGLNHE